MNFKNLTYRQKNRYLLVATGLFLIISYLLAFSGTIELYAENRQLKQQLKLIENAPEQIREYASSLRKLDRKLGPFLQTDSISSDAVLALVSEYCRDHKLVLRSFPKSISQLHADYTIETNIITVQGRYTQLLKLAYALEQQHKAGKIASLRFKTEKDRKTRQTFLTATIYLQNIKKDEA